MSKNQNLEHKSRKSSVAKSTIAMSVATITSRITGLMRTWMMAFALGNTAITSAYQVANNMPNVIFDLVAGGILGAAFIPIFMLEKENHGKEGGNNFCCNVLNIVVIFMGIVSLIALIFAPEAIATQTFTVDSTSYVTEKAIMFFRIFAFQILFYGISSVLTGILNGERIYFIPAFAPAINNIIVIITLLTFFLISFTEADTDFALTILGVGTTLGVAVQAIIQIPALLKVGFKWKPIINFKDPALLEAVKIAIPTIIFVIGALVAFSCRNAFSLNATENGPSTLLYAWTWYQFPYGVIAVSLSRTMFTEISDSFAKNNIQSLCKQVKYGLSTTCILIIPLAVLMGVFAIPLLSLFRAGHFNVNDVNNVALLLQCWVVSLPFYSVVMFLYNVYAAIRKFYVFAIVNLIGVVGQCCLYYIFCTNIQIGLIGITIADFIFYSGCTIVLLIILKKFIGKFDVLLILWRSIRVLIASLIGGIFGCIFIAGFDFGQISMFSGMIKLCFWGALSLLIILILCWIFRIPEILLIINKAKQKLLRK